MDNIVDFKSIWWSGHQRMPQDFFLFAAINRPKKLELVNTTTIYAHYYYDANTPVVMEIRYPERFDYKGFAELCTQCDLAREQWNKLEDQSYPRLGMGGKAEHIKAVTERVLRERDEQRKV